MKTDNEFLELIYEKQTAYRRRRRERRQVLAASATVTLCVAAAVATVILSPRTEQPSIGISNETTATAVTTTTSSAIEYDRVYVYEGRDKLPNKPGVGGADPFRNAPFSFAFGVYSEHRNYVGEEAFDMWINQFQSKGGIRPNHEYNLYTFVKEFNVPRSVLEEFWQRNMMMYEEQTSDFPTLEQINVLYTGTEYEAYCAFAWGSTVIVDNSFYAIGWLADHTADEYVAHGITAEQAQAAVDRGGELHPDDRNHILQQVAALTGKPVTTTTGTIPTVTTTALRITATQTRSFYTQTTTAS